MVSFQKGGCVIFWDIVQNVKVKELADPGTTCMDADQDCLTVAIGLRSGTVLLY